MKRLFVLGILGLVAIPAMAQQNPPFRWTGNHVFVATNDPPPMIDSPSFTVENGAVFGADLTLLNSTVFGGPLDTLFSTTDTLNYTNRGTLIGIPGFDFEYFPLNPPPPQPGVPYTDVHKANTFANIADGLSGGSIFCTNIFGGGDPTFGLGFDPPLFIIGTPGLATLKINASQVLDSGLIGMDSSGLIDIRGDDLDLRRGTFSMSGLSTTSVGLDIDFGGLGTNLFGWSPGADLTPTTALSPIFLAQATFNFEQMFLTNSKPYFSSLTGVPQGNGTNVWMAVFIQDSSPANVTNNVYLNSGFLDIGDFNPEFVVQWAGTVKDPVTGATSTNYFYLFNDQTARRFTNYVFGASPDNQLFPDFRFAETIGTPLGFLGPASASSFANPFPVFPQVTNNYSYISEAITPFAVTNETFGGSVTNVPGRIQLSASQSLNLANTRISGPNYTLISAPVDFRGNSNSVISTPFADLNLGVLGNFLAISNLLDPNVVQWTGLTNPPAVNSGFGFTPMGGIQAWSGSFFFTNTDPVTSNTVVNDVRILMINSALNPTGEAQQQNVQLHTGNGDLVISDILNIFNDFSSDAQVLTITTNGPGAFSPTGQINLLSPNIFWSTSLPNLQFFTNWGTFTSGNLAVFAGNMTDPYSDPNAATPYQAFINHGVITNAGGTFIRTGAFENTGVIEDFPNGSIDAVASGDAIATNGSFIAPLGYVSITANALIASNGMIIAGGGPLTLNTPCSLADGYVLNNQFGEVTNSTFPYIVTNGNTWMTSGGIQIPVMSPSGGDNLLATTITNLATNNFSSVNIWPATDEGVNPQGFGDNLGVGRMLLIADPTSVFTFVPATGGNAMYVDSIELEGNTTNTDGNGNPLSIAIQPGMNIYFAQAVENGVSIAEKLNGKTGGANTNGGHFYWVSNYAGVYSSTNIFYKTDGNTYIFNEALAISPDIASGGPDGSNTGIANINNPEPIPTNETFVISVSPPAVCDPPVVGNPGNPGGTNNPPALQTNFTILQLPSVESPTKGGAGGAGISFVVAQGSYDGLFYDTNGVNPSSAGSFTAKITSKGNYSAKLQLGTGVYSFSGVLDGSGHAARQISGKNLATLSVDLELNNNDQIIGSVSGDGWMAQLLANRAATVSNRAWVGKKTLLLPSDDRYSTTNTGEGFATANLSANGSVQWSGVLPDGVKLSQKSALSGNGIWPVYSSLYGGSGVFIGWMQFTNQPGSEISGTAVWVMPPGHGLYPPGLTNRIDAVGSSVVGTVGSVHAAVILSGGALDQSLTNTVTIFGKMIEGSNRAWKMTVNPQTGLFNGSVTEPNSGQKLSFQGAFLERSGTGGGFFLNADQSGKVYFGPAN